MERWYGMHIHTRSVCKLSAKPREKEARAEPAGELRGRGLGRLFKACLPAFLFCLSPDFGASCEYQATVPVSPPSLLLYPLPGAAASPPGAAMPGDEGRGTCRLNSGRPGPPPEAPAAQPPGPSLRKRALTLAHSLVGGVRSSSGAGPSSFGRFRPPLQAGANADREWQVPGMEQRPAGGGARGARAPAAPPASLPAPVSMRSIGHKTRPAASQSGAALAAGAGGAAGGEDPSHAPSLPLSAVSEASQPSAPPQEAVVAAEEEAAAAAALAAAGVGGYEAALRAALRARAARANAIYLDTFGEERLGALLAAKLTDSGGGAAVSPARHPARPPPSEASPGLSRPQLDSDLGLADPEALSGLSLPPPGLSPPLAAGGAPPRPSSPSLPSDYNLDF